MRKAILSLAGMLVTAAMLAMTVLSSLPMTAQSAAVAVAVTSPPVATPTKMRAAVLAAEETAVAMETRAALNAVAKETSDALALSAQGTRQAQGSQGTAQAMSAQATRQAGDTLATKTASTATASAEARAIIAQETATAHAATATVEAKATAEAQAQQTAVMQAAIDNSELTRVAGVGIAAEATSQAVIRDTEIAESRQMMTTWAGYGALFIFLVGVAFVIWQILPVIIAKIGTVARDERGDLPVVITRGTGVNGVAVFNLPKLWNSVTLLEGRKVRQPVLTPSVALQDDQSKRADYIDLSKGGRPRPVIAMPRTAGAPISQAEPWRVEEQGQDSQPVNWPSRVSLLDVFADKTPSLNHLVLGAYPQADGQLAVVGESLHKLMHILCCGTSGWGKSTFLSSFVWQLAQCKEPVAVVAIDISGSEFNLLRGWAKLQFPVARSDMAAIATLTAVGDELKRRRELFEQFPQARNLARYNRMSDTQLEPWVVLLDEGASLLARRDTGDVLRDAIQTSRQYGIYCLLSSVSANHQVLATQTRDQFSTRLAFRLPKSSMRVVLDETPPEELSRPGRAWARLAGREMVQIQAPIIGERELLAALQPGGPMEQLPAQAEPERDAREQRVAELLEVEPQLSDSTIAQIVYGYQNARVTEKVREIRECLDNRQTDNGV